MFHFTQWNIWWSTTTLCFRNVLMVIGSTVAEQEKRYIPVCVSGVLKIIWEMRLPSMFVSTQEKSSSKDFKIDHFYGLWTQANIWICEYAPLLSPIIERHTLLVFLIVFLRTKAGRKVSFVFKSIISGWEVKESFLSDPILGPFVSQTFSLNLSVDNLSLKNTFTSCK